MSTLIFVRPKHGFIFLTAIIPLIFYFLRMAPVLLRLQTDFHEQIKFRGFQMLGIIVLYG